MNDYSPLLVTRRVIELAVQEVPDVGVGVEGPNRLLRLVDSVGSDGRTN